MSDPVFELKKSNTLALIKTHSCDNEDYIDTNGTDYASMLIMLFAFGAAFDCDNTYLESVLALWADADLVAQKVYYNKTLVNQDNILYAAKTTVSDTCHINLGGTIEQVCLTDLSHIEHLSIQGTTTIKFLIVAAGSSIGDIYVAPGSLIINILIKTCDPIHPSSIGHILGPYTYLAGDAGSTYGGDDCDNILP